MLWAVILASGAIGVLIGLAVRRLFLPARLYYVGKRRPASELPPEQLERIRDAYRDTGWASDYSVEALGIYTTRKSAIKAASVPGGFYHKLPLNHSLPDKPVQFEEHVFPASDRPEIYVEANAPFVAIEKGKMTTVRHGLADLRTILQQ